MKRLAIVAAAVSGVLGLGSLAHAATFTDVSLGTAGPGGFNFTAFQTGPTTFSASNSGTLFNGNVGLAAGGSTNFSGGGTIAGTLYKDPGATVQGNIASQMNVNGGIVTQSLTQAVSDVLNANSTAATLAATHTFASVGSVATTFNSDGSLNVAGGHNTVIDITGNINITNASHNLTLNGGANDFFIINVAGDITVSNGAIDAVAGLPLDHILFNLTGSSSSVNLTNGSSFLDGTYLAPNIGQSINLTPGTVNGSVIGYNIHTSSGPNVDSPTFTGGGVPEPASLGILGLGVVGLIARRRRA